MFLGALTDRVTKEQRVKNSKDHMSKTAKETMMLKTDGKPCMHSLVKLRADADERVQYTVAVQSGNIDTEATGRSAIFSNHFKNHICVVSLRL